MKKEIFKEHPERRKICLNTPKKTIVASLQAVHITCINARFLNLKIGVKCEAIFLCCHFQS